MKKIISFLLIIMISTAGGSAMTVSELSYNPFNGKIYVSGGVTGNEAGSIVTLELIKPGKYTTAEDLENRPDSEAGLIYQHVDQTISETGGAYAFDFKTTAVNGLYTVRLSDTSSSEVEVRSLNIISAGDVEAAIIALNGSTDLAKMQQLFASDNAAKLGFNIPEFTSLANKNEVYNFIINRLAGGGFSATDYDGVTAVFRTAVGLASINQASIASGIDTKIDEIIRAFRSNLKLHEAASYPTYTNEYFDDTFRSNVRKRLINKGFTTQQALSNAFSEAVLLEANLKLKDWSDVIKMIDDNMTTLTSVSGEMLNTSLYNNASTNTKLKMARDVAYVGYTSLSEYIKAVNLGLIETTLTPPAGGGGGGGGGGGIGGNTGVMKAIVPPENGSLEDKPQNRFYDLTGVEWAIGSINLLAEKGIISGNGDGSFSPESNVTREQFVKMLVLAFDLPLTGSCYFSDVDANEWYYPYIAAASNSGLVNGISESEFGVSQNITREQMAALVYRFGKNAGLSFPGGDGTEFNDADMIDQYAIEAVMTMRAADIIKGVGDNNFAPKASAKRAEAAHIIYITLAKFGKIEVIR